jgi:hypothetical protein
MAESCPYCLKLVRKRTKVCPHCQSDLSGEWADDWDKPMTKPDYGVTELSPSQIDDES